MELERDVEKAQSKAGQRYKLVRVEKFDDLASDSKIMIKSKLNGKFWNVKTDGHCVAQYDHSGDEITAPKPEVVFECFPASEAVLPDLPFPVTPSHRILKATYNGKTRDGHWVDIGLERYFLKFTEGPVPIVFYLSKLNDSAVKINTVLANFTIGGVFDGFIMGRNAFNRGDGDNNIMVAGEGDTINDQFDVYHLELQD